MSNVTDFVSRLSVGFSGNTLGTMSTFGNGTMVLVGGPNVTLSQDGRTVTFSAPPPSAGAAISAGTQSQSTGTIIFSSSNGIGFGLNAGTLTASYTVPAAQIPFGISAGTQSVSTGTLVFSDSNGIAFGMSGNSRITASYTVPTVPAQFTAGMSTGGNTSGDTGMVTGRLVMAGGPNITISGSTNAGSITLTVIGGAGAAGNTGFISAGANTASLGTVVFSNSNNVSFGVNGQTVTATVTVPAETPFGVSAGTQSVSTGTLVFSNSNNVTFGMSGSSRVTASASFPAETPFGVSAGTQSVSTGTLVFSNANNVTFGMSGSSRVTASASFPSETPFGVSAGTQSVSTGTLMFSNSNGISFGMSGSSRITASYTVPTGFFTRSNFWNLEPIFFGRQVATNNVLMIAPGPMYQPVVASRADLQLTMSLSTSSNSSHAGAATFFIGVYSKNGLTLSLITSGSTSVAWTNTSNNSVTNLQGARNVSMAFNWTASAGDYWHAVMASTASVNTNWFTLSSFGNLIGGFGQGQGYLASASNTTYNPTLGWGHYSATTGAIPSSIAFSQIVLLTQPFIPNIAYANLTV